MNNPFVDVSKKIANDFLLSIVFIDDKAYNNIENKDNHDFDAYTVSQIFAQKEKICAIYKPKTQNDITYLTTLTQKADITILDWQIILDGEPVTKGKEEEDAPAVDPRETSTLKIIHSIVSDNNSSLKLILIYTGDTYLDEIPETIYSSLLIKCPNIHRVGKWEIHTGNIKIVIIAKESNTFIQLPELNARIKKYSELPDFILDEFTKMTSGLLSNFVLGALTILRNNTFKFLKLYNKDLDIAFLNHRLLLSNQEDANDLLIHVFADSVQALLQYSGADESISKENINRWIDFNSRLFTKVIRVAGNDIPIDSSLLKTWASSNYENAVTNRWSELNYPALNEDFISQINKSEKKLSNEQPMLLVENPIFIQKDIEFSILTHHKSLFKPKDILPKLTLGAIVKGHKTNKYWVCIQQRCDSVRIEEPRRFLFLPLKVITDNKRFNFLTNDGIKLQLAKDSFDLRTIKFEPENSGGEVKAKLQDDKFIFEPIYKTENDELYEWVLDLKDLHAQRIAHAYANQLSRVGLDESEWLRRKGL